MTTFLSIIPEDVQKTINTVEDILVLTGLNNDLDFVLLSRERLSAVYYVLRFRKNPENNIFFFNTVTKRISHTLEKSNPPYQGLNPILYEIFVDFPAIISSLNHNLLANPEAFRTMEDL